MTFQTRRLPIKVFSLSRSSLFTPKPVVAVQFLCIRRSPSTALHLQTNGPTERPNSTMRAYFWLFVNFELQETFSDDQIRLPHCEECEHHLYTFELNCYYHPRMSELKMLLPLPYLRKDSNYSYLPRVTAGAGLQGRGGCTRIRYKRCKIATQTHCIT